MNLKKLLKLNFPLFRKYDVTIIDLDSIKKRKLTYREIKRGDYYTLLMNKTYISTDTLASRKEWEVRRECSMTNRLYTFQATLRDIRRHHGV